MANPWNIVNASIRDSDSGPGYPEHRTRDKEKDWKIKIVRWAEEKALKIK